MISNQTLYRTPFSSFVSDEQYKAFSQIAGIRSYEKGQTIVEMGAPAEALFYLMEGSIAHYHVITIQHNPTYRKEYYVYDVNPGDIFGISALIEPYIYTATLKANKPSRVLKIYAEELRELCESDDKLYKNLLIEVSKAAMERLHATRILLAAASIEVGSD